METIKFNGKEYQLVSGGYQLRDTSGRIIFLPGDVDFATIKNDLKTATSLELLDSAGKTIASRTDLVYARRLQEDESWIIGSEQVETGTDEDGNPVYTTQDVTGTVMIAEFREPDLREQLAETNAKVDYIAMMNDIDLEA